MAAAGVELAPDAVGVDEDGIGARTFVRPLRSGGQRASMVDRQSCGTRARGGRLRPGRRRFRRGAPLTHLCVIAANRARGRAQRRRRDRDRAMADVRDVRRAEHCRQPRRDVVQPARSRLTGNVRRTRGRCDGRAQQDGRDGAACSRPRAGRSNSKSIRGASASRSAKNFRFEFPQAASTVFRWLVSRASWSQIFLLRRSCARIPRSRTRCWRSEKASRRTPSSTPSRRARVNLESAPG